MKFAINRTISHSNNDRVLVTQRLEDYFKDGGQCAVKYLVCALVEVSRDWSEDDEFPIVSDTDSIQIRPKGIFKSSKGYYYKNSGKPTYLTSEEVEQMKIFNENFLKSL